MTVCSECKGVGGAHGMECSSYPFPPKSDHDPVNHPSHYTAYKGVEVIDLTEQMNFNRGNAVKYICRAGLKDPEKTVEDLEKAAWYLDREITRIKGESE